MESDLRLEQLDLRLGQLDLRLGQPGWRLAESDLKSGPLDLILVELGSIPFNDLIKVIIVVQYKLQNIIAQRIIITAQ